MVVKAAFNKTAKRTPQNIGVKNILRD